MNFKTIKLLLTRNFLKYYKKHLKFKTLKPITFYENVIEKYLLTLVVLNFTFLAKRYQVFKNQIKYLKYFL